jgi:hypothetical protein
MTSGQRAYEYGHKAAAKWEILNRPEQLRGYQPFTLGHMLGQAWRMGFEAGKRQQVKTQKAKEMEMKQS